MHDDIIQIRGLSKRYARYATPLARIHGLLQGRDDSSAFEALAPLDFTIRRGECFGIIGRNGSGKSTLLKLLCGIIAPSTGRVVLGGRALGMIELGAGFQPDFTGRENARINALVQGLSADEVVGRMPLIEAFADIGPYFDRPVRTYSTGMYARLGFAVSAHVDADILIVDEILAVGDASFQQKCAQWMRQFRSRGGTVVLVSHSVGDISDLCDRALWLDHGQSRGLGPAREIATAYQRAMMAEQDADGRTDGAAPHARPIPPRTSQAPDWQGQMVLHQGRFDRAAKGHGHGGAVVIDAGFFTAAGSRAETLEGGADMILKIRARALRDLDAPILGFIFRDANGRNLFGDNTYLTTCESPVRFTAGQVFEAEFHGTLPYLPAGRYTLAPSVIEGTQDDHVHLHWVEHAVTLHVTQSPVEFGLVGVPMKAVG